MPIHARDSATGDEPVTAGLRILARIIAREATFDARASTTGIDLASYSLDAAHMGAFNSLPEMDKQ